MNTPQSTFGNTVQEFYLRQVRAIDGKRKEKLASLKTREDAERYVKEVREKIKKSFSLPTEKTPLKAFITDTLKQDGFSIEKVIYQSRPGLFVTGNFYLPDDKTGPFPAVLLLCGHSQEGKACGNYQLACRNLAMQGYAVFCIDPVSQGERYQFLNVPNSRGISGSCTTEHNMLGKQQLLTGEFFGTWRAWDAIRAIDYMTSRPEIDSSRIGVTGNSGGGTMTTFVNALEERLSMAATSCYITSWKRNIENELPADIEQIPPGLLGMGCEMGDLLIARAPRPVLILGQKNDFFDARGTAETYEEVKRIYALLGAEDNVRLFIGPVGHGLSQHNRETIYSFFNTHAGISGVDGLEPKGMHPLPETELFCTQEGQTVDICGSRLIRDFTMEKADILAKQRTSHTEAELREIFQRHLVLDTPKAPYYRTLRSQTFENRRFSRFALETEPDMLAILKIMSSEEFFHIPESEKTVLYIPHLNSLTEMAEMEFELGCLVTGLDIRGIGELRPTGCDQQRDNFFEPYGSDYHYASCGLLLGKPYLGGKVFDVLCALKLLKQRGAKNIQLVGRGLGAIVTALAALFTDDLAGITLYDAPESWDSMLRTPITLWPQSHMLRGILAETDLPQVYEVLKSKNLEMRKTGNRCP